jgi:N,N-dimethylformamidase beta subunit-like protein
MRVLQFILCCLIGAALLIAIAEASFGGIVSENQLPGATDWYWTGTISDNCELFTDNVSYLPGQTVGFKAQTSAAGTLDIYRVGWYAGLGARKVATLTVPAKMQPAATFTAATFTIDALNWTVSVSWPVPAGAVSGYYLASLRVGSMQFVYPFIVRSSAYHDILMQASNTTWNAYSGWGGYNLYGQSNFTGQRAYAVSFNRPLSAQYGWGLYAGPQDSWDSAEMAAIHFLERNGYDVAYQTGVDTDRYGCGSHHVFISVGHDEYWSSRQRSNVFSALYSGMNLCFWSGNECFWEVRYSPDYRTMTCYKTDVDGKADPVSWTGLFRDPQSGTWPENSLTGQLFKCDDSAHPQAIVVPGAMAANPFWRNTAIQRNGGGSLVSGLLQYETDEPFANGFEPAVTLLSQTTYATNNFILSDTSTAEGSGTMTHEMTIWTATSGAKVFGAGTVFWSFGLDSFHDYDPKYAAQVPVDPNVQQATINILGDMGALPGSLTDGVSP